MKMTKVFIPRFKTEGYEFDDAKMRWCNFEGRVNDNNSEGNRNFGIELDEESAKILIDDGYNVKQSKYDPDEYYLAVKMKLACDGAKKPPIIYQITDRAKINITDDMINMIDGCVDRATLVIRPYEYEPGQKSAWLCEYYYTVIKDVLSDRYSDYSEYPAEEAPNDDNLPF